MRSGNKQHFIVFNLGERQLALPLAPVKRVIRAVAVTPLPRMPEVVCGIINYRGTVVPVIDIRPRFKFPSRPIVPEDNVISVQTEKRLMVLTVDMVIDNIEKDETEVIKPDHVVEGTAFMEAVLKMPDGILLVPDLEKILTPVETEALDKTVDALAEVVGTPPTENGEE